MKPDNKCKKDNSKYQINDTIIKDMKKRISEEKILSCLILKDNSIIFEHYKNKKVSSNVQTINSCTKSVISALVGIALDKGLIESINTPITEFFGDIINRETDSRKRNITIEHLLNMTIGTDWPEFGEWNCFAPMVYSNDMIKFILQRPIDTDPGQKMNYNSGCSHLLSAIIQKVSGISAHDFAKEYLFKPIGISKSVWHERQGTSLGSDGLRITAEDMVKFGQLFLNKGNFNGKQVISEQWIKESTIPRHITYMNIGHYEHHWWASSHKRNDREISYYFALGYGGQYIIVVPDFNMVVTFTSRMYNNSLRPIHYFKNYILESIEM